MLIYLENPTSYSMVILSSLVLPGPLCRGQTEDERCVLPGREGAVRGVQGGAEEGSYWLGLRVVE